MSNDNGPGQIKRVIQALTDLLPELEQELDERRHGGNAEEFAELEAKIAEARAALAAWEGEQPE